MEECLSAAPRFHCQVVSHLGNVNSPVFSWLLGPDLDPHRGLHNCLWGHVCKDLESPCHLQKCKDEEEGNQSPLLQLAVVTQLFSCKQEPALGRQPGGETRETQSYLP